MKVPTSPKPSKQMAKRPNAGVKNLEKHSVFKTVITLIASAIIAAHLIICLILIANPKFIIFNSETFSKVYLRYALPGPYFRADLIMSSPNFYIAGKKGKTWEKWRTPELDNFNAFHNQYWHYDKLKQGDLERNLARTFCRRVVKDSVADFTTFKEFKKLRKYFESEYFRETPDSIRMLYTLSTYKPRERKTKIDTLFFLKYKP